MAEDGGEQTVSNIIVFVGVFFDKIDYFELSLGQIAVYFLPDFVLIVLVFRFVFVDLLILIFFNKLIKLVVLYLDIDGRKNELIA